MGCGEGCANEELQSLYRSPNTVRMIKSRKLRCKPTGRRPLGKPMHIKEVNITMNLKEIDISIRNWVDSGQDRGCWRVLVNAKLSLRDP